MGVIEMRHVNFIVARDDDEDEGDDEDKEEWGEGGNGERKGRHEGRKQKEEKEKEKESFQVDPLPFPAKSWTEYFWHLQNSPTQRRWTLFREQIGPYLRNTDLDHRLHWGKLFYTNLLNYRLLSSTDIHT